MHLHRFQLGIETLIRVRDERLPFSICSWVSEISKEVHPFGFAFCAVGYMMVDPLHNAEGLLCHLSGPRYGHHDNWDAICWYFDISFHSACDLFAQDAYENGADTSVEEVISRMIKFLESGQRDLGRATSISNNEFVL